MQQQHEPEPPTDMIDLVAAAGASEAMLAVLMVDPEDANLGASFPRSRLMSEYAMTENPTPASFGSHYSEASSFMGKLWRGDLYRAFLKADISNKQLMREAFTKEHMIAAGLASDKHHPDEVRHIIDERW